MRCPFVAARAIVAAVVAISVGACAATPASPSPSETAPAASASVSATSSTDVDRVATAIDECGSRSLHRLASISAGAQIDSRIQVGEPVAPRWFASDGRSLWVHEPTSLVRVDLATSAITGQVPMDRMDYGYVTTGAGAVWQTDFESRRPPEDRPGRRQGGCVDPVVGSAPEGVAVTAGSVWVADHHRGAVTRIDPKTNRVVATIPIGPTGADGPLAMTAGPGGCLGGRPQHGFGGADRSRDEQGRTAGAAGRPGGE